MDHQQLDEEIEDENPDPNFAFDGIHPIRFS